MPKLVGSFTEKTGGVHPQAVIVIWGLQIVLRQGSPPQGEFEVRGYVDQAALDTGKEPMPDLTGKVVAFTPDDIAALQAQFASAVYARLLTRPEFASFQLVP